MGEGLVGDALLRTVRHVEILDALEVFERAVRQLPTAQHAKRMKTPLERH